jgi:hypothetical protein
MSIRSAFLALAAAGMLVASSGAASQTADHSRSAWELRITGGGLIPTGTQRKSIDDAQQTTAQLTWRLKPSLAINGTFGWARSRDVGMTERPRLDVFTSDLGIEARPTLWLVTRSATFSPFIGAGAGMRSYNHRSLDLDATHNPAAYVSAGGELGFGRMGLRVEVRDYVSGFKALSGGDGDGSVRNDVMIMTGLRFNRRQTPAN